MSKSFVCTPSSLSLSLSLSLSRARALALPRAPCSHIHTHSHPPPQSADNCSSLAMPLFAWISRKRTSSPWRSHCPPASPSSRNPLAHIAKPRLWNVSGVTRMPIGRPQIESSLHNNQHVEQHRERKADTVGRHRSKSHTNTSIHAEIE